MYQKEYIQQRKTVSLSTKRAFPYKNESRQLLKKGIFLADNVCEVLTRGI
jgi:hypothetical protein